MEGKIRIVGIESIIGHSDRFIGLFYERQGN